MASCQHGTAGFAEDDFSRMAELLDTALAVAHADPETAPVCAAAPRTELRSCPTKSLTNPPGRHRVVQAVLSPCDWSEKRCDSTDSPSYIPLNAEPETCRLPRKGARWCPDLLLRIVQTLGFARADEAANLDSRAKRVAHEAFSPRFVLTITQVYESVSHDCLVSRIASPAPKIASIFDLPGF